MLALIPKIKEIVFEYQFVRSGSYSDLVHHILRNMIAGFPIFYWLIIVIFFILLPLN